MYIKNSVSYLSTHISGSDNITTEVAAEVITRYLSAQLICRAGIRGQRVRWRSERQLIRFHIHYKKSNRHYKHVLYMFVLVCTCTVHVCTCTVHVCTCTLHALCMSVHVYL